MNEKLRTIPQPQQVTALILGAGEGCRLGLGPKAFLHQRGKTLLQLAVEAVRPFAHSTIAAVRQADLDRARALNCAAAVIEGGATRQQSLSALVALAKTEYVLVHEVARPYAETDLFTAVLEAASVSGAAALYRPVEARDSFAILNGDHLSTVVPASNLVMLQTPHAYRTEVLRDADLLAKRDGWVGSGTAELMTRYGYPVKLVAGSAQNIKITYQTDWEIEQAA